MSETVNRATLFALAALYLFISIDTYAQDWSAVHVDEFLVRLLIVSPEDGSAGVCTGVVINAKEDYVVTAAHCVPPSATASIAAGRHHADVLKRNYALDVAVLQVKGLDAPAVMIRRVAAPVGLPVALAGYGFAGSKPVHTYGWLSEGEDDTILAAHTLLDAEAIGGMSGGGIFDADGALVTIVGGVLRAHVGRLSYGPTPEVLAHFLKPYLKEPKP